ncbi:hypothetical protein H0266_18580 [Halobacillus locisalis]|uniref:Conjugal transfer protein n=1 Tax=Halobacillus locisalis TaxID=220753 RepID=A0A838CY64_9BACI|nr:hypothetical protein [Halobacillus locisalis]MBA2176890.1 hypothetical protein [Halobacillus locisalis]
MGFSGVVDFIQEQAGYLLTIALIVILLVTGFKRQWIVMAGSVFGLAIIAIFITTPTILGDIGEKIAELMNLG